MALRCKGCGNPPIDGWPWCSVQCAWSARKAMAKPGADRVRRRPPGRICQSCRIEIPAGLDGCPDC